MEKTIREEGYGWDSVGYGKYIVEFEWSFSGSMVGLQFKILLTMKRLIGSREIEIQYFNHVSLEDKNKKKRSSYILISFLLHSFPLSFLESKQTKV